MKNFEEEYTEDVSAPCPEGRGVTLEDFVAYMPTHVYIFTPCREPWSGASVNSRLPRVHVLDENERLSMTRKASSSPLAPALGSISTSLWSR